MVAQSYGAARREPRREFGRQAVDRHLYLASVYIQTAAAVAISAAAALLAARNPVLAGTLFAPNGLTPAGWLVTLAPLGLVIVLGAGVEKLSVEAARLLFLVYAILVGLSLGSVFFAFSGQKIGYAFLTAAAGFTGLAAIGTVTKRDLGPLGGFLTVALFGLVAAMVLSLFLPSGIFNPFLAGAGILLFAGLTAYDVQRLRQMHDERPQAAAVGGLALYLDFINLFLSLLRFIGRGRR